MEVFNKMEEGIKKVTEWWDNVVENERNNAQNAVNRVVDNLGIAEPINDNDDGERNGWDWLFGGIFRFGRRRQMSIDELMEALVAERYGMEQEEELSVQQKREEYLADFESMHQFDPVPEEELADRTPEMILSLLNVGHTSKMKFEKEQAEMEEMEISEEQERHLSGLREIVADSEDREDALSRLLNRLEEMRERD